MTSSPCIEERNCLSPCDVKDERHCEGGSTDGGDFLCLHYLPIRITQDCRLYAAMVVLPLQASGRRIFCAFEV